MSDPLPPLPRFIIVGAQKSATRWLRWNLGRHPEIFTPDDEPSFFDHPKRVERRGLDWYRSQFAGWSGEPITGEATPGYLMPRHDPAGVARRIDDTLPDVRLIAILRNPIDRAHSALRHHIKRGRLPPDADLLKVVASEPPGTHRLGLISGGWYAQSLTPYVNIFGDRLLVLLHDDLIADPSALYRTALEHVGADRAFTPGDLDEVRFSNREQYAKRALSRRERRQLYEYFREDLGRLEALIGRDLSSWDPRR